MNDQFIIARALYRQPGICGLYSERRGCFDWCDLLEGHTEVHHYRPTTRKERRARLRQMRRD